MIIMLNLANKINYPIKLGLLISVMLIGFVARAEVLDRESGSDPWLDGISEALDRQGIDIIYNLNHRELARGKIDKPRLGRFPDLPLQQYPSTNDLLAWEREFDEGSIGGVAVIIQPFTNDDLGQDYASFSAAWHAVESTQRVFISFHMADISHIQNLVVAMGEHGSNMMVFSSAQTAEYAGRLFATAGSRMAMDSVEARRHRSEVSEFKFLGKRVKRNSNSIFAEDGGEFRRLARSEPAVFRKRSLGDEYEASTIEEIIVPGGIALGEVAVLHKNMEALSFIQGEFWLQDSDGAGWQLPHENSASLKAMFDFVNRSESIRSDAIVDIDAEGRVKISSAFRDTDIGYQLMELDTQPFKFVRRLPVTKSVMIDTAVSFFPDTKTGELTYATDYEVRFLTADTMRIAQTRVALEYSYAAAISTAVHSYGWGRDLKRLDENMDYAGLGSNTGTLARYAAWISLFRKVVQDQIRFVDGRYEFMKLDKQGKKTPSRI